MWLPVELLKKQIGARTRVSVKNEKTEKSTNKMSKSLPPGNPSETCGSHRKLYRDQKSAINRSKTYFFSESHEP